MSTPITRSTCDTCGWDVHGSPMEWVREHGPGRCVRVRSDRELLEDIDAKLDTLIGALPAAYAVERRP